MKLGKRGGSICKHQFFEIAKIAGGGGCGGDSYIVGVRVICALCKEVRDLVPDETSR